jgi:hypothetical protein
MGSTLKKEDLVYLLRKNIKTKWSSLKLDYIKLGLFKIRKALGPLIYRLELSSNMWIHLVFHISLLELAPKNVKLAHIQLSNET